jgi:diguanylate cyclase (GGDEF)-like protein
LDRFRPLKGPILTGTIWLAVALAELWLRDWGHAVLLVWLPSGIAVAALYAAETRRWPATLAALGVAQVAMSLAIGFPLLSGIGYAAANAAEAIVCTSIGLRVLGGRRRPPSSLRHIVGLFAAAVAGAIASALIVYPFRSIQGPEELAWWFLASVIGILAGVPVLLYVRQRLGFGTQDVELREDRSRSGLLLASLAMFVLAAVVLNVSAVSMLWLLMVMLVFVAIRHGQLGAALGVLAITAAATAASYGGNSPADFLNFPPKTAGLVLQAMMLAMLATSMPIAAMLLTRNRLEAQLREQNAALAENLTTLHLAERISGIGRWHYDIRSGRQTWSELMLEINGLPRDLAPDPGNVRDLLPDGGEVLFGEIARHREDREPYSFDYRVKPPGSPERFLRIVVKNEFGASGERVALFAVAMDVTAQVRREEALDLARARAIGLAAEAQKLAMTDPLTGLANRRATLDWLGNLVSASDQDEDPLAVLMFDVDHFKRINDCFGHQTGDEVLKRVAALARAQLRAEDLVGRIGGEEFICIVSGLSDLETRSLAERLCLAIATGSAADNLPQTTISIGLARFRNGDTPEDLLARADAAVYEAKDAGRNQVRLAA